VKKFSFSYATKYSLHFAQKPPLPSFIPSILNYPVYQGSILNTFNALNVKDQDGSRRRHFTLNLH